MSNPIVAVLMGSKSDHGLVQPAANLLTELGISHEVRVLSAHRTTTRTIEFAAGAREKGFKVIICAAGGAAHLAGIVAAQTTLPVIGVPLARTPLAGNDALLATIQMPRGIPVATVTIDGSYNAALLAAQIIGVSNLEIAVKLDIHRQIIYNKIINDDETLLAKQRYFQRGIVSS